MAPFILLLFLIAVIVVLVVAISKSNRDTDSPRPTMPDTPAAPPPSSVVEVNPFAEVVNPAPQGPVAVSIYAHPAMLGACRCPICDGENPVTCGACCICGAPLAKKEVAEYDL